MCRKAYHRPNVCAYLCVIRCDVPIHTYSKYICSRIVTKEMAAFSSHLLGAFSSHLCRVPTIQFQFISTHIKGPYYPGNCIKGPYYPALTYDVRNRCGAVPFPARRWFNQFPCSALEFQLRWGMQVEDISTQLRYTRLNLRSLSRRGGGPRRRSLYLRSL